MPKEPCIAPGQISRTTGVELAGVQELNEMEATKNKKVPTDESYCVSAEDVADKIIALMQRGCNPLQLSRSTWVLFQPSRNGRHCQDGGAAAHRFRNRLGYH